MAKILVTGANRGIGLELCRQLKARGDEVIAVCRNSSPELDGLDVRVIDGIDVAEDETVARLSELFAGEKLDVVVNNAGILTFEPLNDLDWDRMRKQFEVNALGPLRVTSALLPTLSEGSKLIILTSRVGSMADNSSGGIYGYRMSKAAANMAGVNLALELRDRGIAVGIFHPGLVATEMTSGRGVPIPDSAARLITRIDELTMEQSGVFRHAEGEELPW